MISHDNIEKSFYKYVYDNVEQVWEYSINYGSVMFDSIQDVWLDIVFEESNAGAKKVSSVRIDIVTRVNSSTQYYTDETSIVDNLRSVLTKATIFMYNFVSDTPVLISNEVLIIKNDVGKLTVNRVLRDNNIERDIENNLRRTSIYFNLELLSDTVGGRSV
jgi:hypothetical protein